MTPIADPIDYLIAQNDTVIDALCAYLIDEWNAPNTAHHARELGVAGILEADAEKHFVVSVVMPRPATCPELGPVLSWAATPPAGGCCAPR